jgi:hypothetical protein
MFRKLSELNSSSKTPIDPKKASLAESFSKQIEASSSSSLSQSSYSNQTPSTASSAGISEAVL